jgi:hypothetical protein
MPSAQALFLIILAEPVPDLIRYRNPSFFRVAAWIPAFAGMTRYKMPG